MEKTLKAKYLEHLVKLGMADDEVKHYKNQIFDIVLFDDGYIPFYKGYLEKNICFGYDSCSDSQSGTTSYEEAQKNVDNVGLDYFIKENTKSIDRNIKELEKEGTFYLYRAYMKYDEKQLTIIRMDDTNKDKFDEECIVRELSVEEVKTILNMVKKLKEYKAKRCTTWWKRFGRKYLNVWTYDYND